MKSDFACCVATTRLRPIRSNLAYRFGLQDTKQEIVAGERQPNGTLVLDFSLKGKGGQDPQHPCLCKAASPVVLSMIVSSIYAGGLAIERGHYINRVKARLVAVD